MTDLLPSAFSRMTGISVPRLRDYADRGWLPPETVDIRTGHRRYHRRQVDDAILLRALISTGMPASRAAGAVRSQDRSAVLAHLGAVTDAVAEARERLPVPGKQTVRDVWWDGELRIEPVDPDRPAPRRFGSPVPDVPAAARHLDPLERARWARRLLCEATGLAPEELPRAVERDEGLPDGPVVLLEVGPGCADEEPKPRSIRAVHLPWPLDEAAPEGFCHVLTPGRDYGVMDLAPREWSEHPAVDDEVAVIGAWMPTAWWSDGALVWDAMLTRAALAVGRAW